MARHWLGIGAVTIAGFAAWLTYELTRPPVVPEPPAPAADAPLGELPGLETEAPALASLHVTLERPLFDEDRRPDPPADAAGPGADKPETDKPLPMRLSAVIVGAPCSLRYPARSSRSGSAQAIRWLGGGSTRSTTTRWS